MKPKEIAAYFNEKLGSQAWPDCASTKEEIAARKAAAVAPRCPLIAALASK